MSEGDLVVVTPAWRESHSGAAVGFLALGGVANPPSHPALADVKAALEADIRARFGELDRAALRETPPLSAYAAYYKRFGQRYHVAMQLESVAQKGKRLPNVAALVEAMFVAELRHLVLTAGHDLDGVTLPLRLDSATGSDAERFTAPNGTDARVKVGDMYVADAKGVLSSIITGPSSTARIGPETTSALFVTYAPPGVSRELLDAHLTEIEANVCLVSPEGEMVARVVIEG